LEEIFTMVDLNKIDWKRKLSSRKFWVAIAAWITSLLTAFNVGENVIAQVGVIVAGIGALAVYMLAEAKSDAANAGFITTTETVIETEDETKE
jgi:uncharacterized membrane protein